MHNNFKHALKLFSTSAYASVCQRMPTCFKRIQPMHNIPLVYVSVYQRMSDMFHTLTYARTKRYSVTAMLPSGKAAIDIALCHVIEIRWTYAVHTLLIR